MTVSINVNKDVIVSFKETMCINETTAFEVSVNDNTDGEYGKTDEAIVHIAHKMMDEIFIKLLFKGLLDSRLETIKSINGRESEEHDLNNEFVAGSIYVETLRSFKALGIDCVYVDDSLSNESGSLVVQSPLVVLHITGSNTNVYMSEKAVENLVHRVPGVVDSLMNDNVALKYFCDNISMAKYCLTLLKQSIIENKVKISTSTSFHTSTHVSLFN